MKENGKQFSIIIILILAIFIQMEGKLPDLFAGSEDPIQLEAIVEELQLKAIIEGESFSGNEALNIQAIFANISKEPIGFYAGSTAHGIRGVVGATLRSKKGESRFSEELELETTGRVSDSAIFSGSLSSGEELGMEFNLLPYYKEHEVIKNAEPGEYILTLWYSESEGNTIKADFPVKVIKRFGKMYIKG